MIKKSVIIFLLLLSKTSLASFIEKTADVHFDDGKVPSVSSYDLKLSYLEAHSEKQRTILFIHGNSASKEAFGEIIKNPAFKDYRVIAVDLPGHGKSSNFPDDIRQYFKDHEDDIFRAHQSYYTFSGYAHSLVQFLKDLKVDPKELEIYGWSLGGHVAIDMVAEEPSIRRVTLTGTPINNFEKSAQGFAALKTFPTSDPFPAGKTVFDLLSFRDPFTEKQAEAFHRLGGLAPSEFVRKAGMRTDPEARYFMIKFVLEALQSQSQLGNYENQEKTAARHSDKFVVLQGEKDPIKISAEDRQRIELMGIPIHEVEGASHALFADEPNKVADLLVRFFDTK